MVDNGRKLVEWSMNVDEVCMWRAFPDPPLHNLGALSFIGEVVLWSRASLGNNGETSARECVRYIATRKVHEQDGVCCMQHVGRIHTRTVSSRETHGYSLSPMGLSLMTVIPAEARRRPA
jgi:hypothetical protein